MQDHCYSFEVEATPQQLWRPFWNKHKGQVLERGDVRIVILHAVDANGEGGCANAASACPVTCFRRASRPPGSGWPT